MGSIVEEEDYGRRLLHVVVENASRKNPNRVAYSFPITNDPAQGFHDITNKQYANGVNRTAWWLEKNFGKPEPGSFPTIGYIGPGDLRYPLLTLGAVKVGFKMMFLSPRNSVDGHLAVNDKCGCNLWVLPTQRVGHVDQVLEKRPMTVVPLPEVLEFLDKEPVPIYPYSKTFAEARQDPFLVLHTSGSTGLPKPIVVLENARPAKNSISVLLTGSTGSLGTYLLDCLLSLKHISRVYCLNRSTNGEERQTQVNKSRGLPSDWSSGRVKFLHADLSKPNFGTDPKDYAELLESITHVIHNQWQVDFNLTLSSFTPHIQGVRNLINFSLASPKSPSLFFISSVGVVNNQQTNATVPETLITDLSVTEGGYGSSKLVSEFILSEAYTRSGVRSSICRVGQIAGPVDGNEGVWNKHEWLPSIIASSKYLGLLPSSLPSLNRIDWLPVNRLSRVILELNDLSTPIPAPTPSSSTIPIFHTVNPATVPWSSLLPTISATLGSEVKIVNWNTWIEKLKESERKGGDLEKNPGVKLLGFYEGMGRMGAIGLENPILETVETSVKSKSLGEVGRVRGSWVEGWMRGWGF